MSLTSSAVAAPTSGSPPSGRPAAAPSPLAATLRRVAAHSNRWQVQIGIPDAPGWVPTAEVRTRLDELIAQVAVAFRTSDPAVAGTFFLNGYARAAVGAALLSLATERRVPDIAPTNVAFRFGPNGIALEIALAAPRFVALPADPAAGHPDATIVRDVQALRHELRRSFVDGHIADLIEPLRVRTHRGPRALWATASDMCSGVLAILASSTGSPEALEGESRAFLGTGGPLLEAPPISPAWRRLTCCLAYRLPGHGLCSSCPCLGGCAIR